MIRDVEKNLGEFSRTTKDVSKSVQKVGKTLGSLGSTLTTHVTLPLAGASVAAFKFGADLEDAVGATDQIYKGASSGIQDWAANLDSSYGIAESQALTYADTMGAMLKNIGGLTEDQAAKQAEKLIELAGDLTAMYGGSTDDAVRALTGALKGNNTMLDNYGMGVNDATVKTKALSMGLYNGTGQMSLSAKQAATLALIMEQTGDAQGQAARETDSASGSMRGFKTELQNVATMFGQTLLPIITPFISKLRDLMKSFKNLSPETQENIVKLAGLAIALGPTISLISRITLGTSRLLTKLSDLERAFKHGKGLMETIFTPGTKVAIVITLIVIAVILLIKNWDKLKEAMKRVKEHFDKLKNTVNEVKNKIIDFKDNAVEKVKTKLDDFKQTLEDNKGTIKAVAGVLTAIFGPALVQTGVKASVAGGKIAGSFVANIIKTGTQATVNGAKLTASFIASMVKAGWEAVIAAGKITVSFIGSLIKTAAQAAVTATTISGHLIVSMVQYAAQGWKTVASIVATTAAWIAQKAVMIGTTVATYAAAGAQKLLNAVMAANPILLVIGLLAGLVLGLIALYHHSETARNIMNNLWNGIKNGATKAKKAVHNMVTKVKGYWNDLKTFLKNPIKGTVNIVQKGVGWVKNKVGHNAYGTNNWGGGLTWVGEQGPELINLPRGSKVYPTNESASMAKGLRPSQITIAKLADQIVVREDADIDRIATALVKKLDKAEVAYGGGAI